MDHKEKHHLRLYVLAGFFFAVMVIYAGLLFHTQVTNYEYYYTRSIRNIARSETVEAARGNITDRNGKVMVSSRSSYNLTFDPSLLDSSEDPNEAILRLLNLCQSRAMEWEDYLPITRTEPFSYQLDSLSDTKKKRFLTYSCYAVWNNKMSIVTAVLFQFAVFNYQNFFHNFPYLF